jgi:hypothetical protein
VLKVISWTKSRRAPLAQAQYAARTRLHDATEASLPMINEEGRELRGATVAAEIRSWELSPDAENLSPAARRAGARERVAMPDGERLQRRQAAHLIFSIPAHARADADRLDRSVRTGLAETLGEGGFRYVYAIHTDHSSRPHAHIIVKAQSEPFRTAGGAIKSRQLRLGPAELEAMRQVMTRHAQQLGLSVTATRREDRAELRQEILDGRAPLRANKSMHQATIQTRQGRTFERRAPRWYAEHGYDYERRRLAAVGQEPSSPVPTEPSRAPGLFRRLVDRFTSNSVRTSDAQGRAASSRQAGYFSHFDNYRKGVEAADARISAHFEATHRDPAKALTSFRLMLREAPRLALWAAHHHPIAFGEPTGAVAPGLRATDFRAALRAEQRQARPSNGEKIGDDPLLSGERARIRRALANARSPSAVERQKQRISASIGRVATKFAQDSADRATDHDRADTIRELAGGHLPNPSGAHRPPPLTDRRHTSDKEVRVVTRASQGSQNRSELYEQLNDELQRRHRAGANRKRDRDYGGPAR